MCLRTCKKRCGKKSEVGLLTCCNLFNNYGNFTRYKDIKIVSLRFLRLQKIEALKVKGMS